MTPFFIGWILQQLECGILCLGFIKTALNEVLRERRIDPLQISKRLFKTIRIYIIEFETLRD
jgi:hypothetical protein